jgi:hypothetical protein
MKRINATVTLDLGDFEVLTGKAKMLQVIVDAAHSGKELPICLIVEDDLHFREKQVSILEPSQVDDIIDKTIMRVVRMGFEPWSDANPKP